MGAGSVHGPIRQPHLLADQRRLRAVDDVERLEDRRDVRLHRLFGELQLIGDDLVGLALAEALQHLDLALGERHAAGAARAAEPLLPRVADVVEDERRHVELAVEHQPDRRHQRMLAGRFRHVAERALRPAPARVLRVLRGRQHDDGHVGADAAEFGDRRHAAHARHHQVEHDDVEIGALGRPA